MFYRCGPLVATIVVSSDVDSDGSLVWARSETVFQGGMWFSGRSTLALVGDLHWHESNYIKNT